MNSPSLPSALRRWALAVVATALACSGLLAPAVAQAGDGRHDLRAAASRVLAFLSSKQLADGSLDERASETEDFILGDTAAGRDPNRLVASSGKSVYDFLAADIADATVDSNRTGKLVQALVAGRRDPTSLAGQNILARLEGPGARAGGFYDPVTGAFNVNDTSFSVNAAFH